MKRQYSIIFLSVLAIGVFSDAAIKERVETFDDYELEDNSSNPPLGNTGAPGESSCVSCHSGSTLPAAGVVEFEFDGMNAQYVPGQTYSIVISSSGNAKNGFQMTALDGTNNAAGTFTAGTGSSLGTANGRRYIRHSTSNNTSSWSFQWTAPNTNQGNVTFYYSYAKANGAGGNSGDQIYLGNTTIQPDIASGIHELTEIPVSFELTVLHREITLSYSLQESANMYVCIQDLSGKQMAFQNFGKHDKGVFKTSFMLDHQLISGIYFVTLFVNNQPITSKIHLP
jgi:hypothetical protein